MCHCKRNICPSPLMSRKPIVDYAHGGDPGSDEDYIELYMLLRREKSWHEAKQNCEDRNGTLLRAVEGNQEELYSFSERLNGTYWLGVYSVFQEGSTSYVIFRLLSSHCVFKTTFLFFFSVLVKSNKRESGLD